jgi:hypothetical protein
VKQIWQGRAAQAVAKYGDHAPMAAVCCNACRTCLSTNVIGIAAAALAGSGYAVARFARRVAQTA